MKKIETVKVLVLIESAYPRFRLRSETVEDWFSHCDEMDFDKVIKNVYSHIRRSPYPPGIAEIASLILDNENESFNHKLTLCNQRKDRSKTVPAWLNEYVPAKSII